MMFIMKINSIILNSILIAFANTTITYTIFLSISPSENTYKAGLLFLLLHPFIFFFSLLLGIIIVTRWLNKKEYNYHSLKEKWTNYSLPIFLLSIVFIVVFDYINFYIFDWKVLEYEKSLSKYLLSKNDQKQHIKHLPLIFQNIHFIKWCLPFLIILFYLMSKPKNPTLNSY